MRSPTIEQKALARLDDEDRPLVRRLLNIPSWRERYLAFLRTLVTQTLDWQVIGPRIGSWRHKIDDIVQQDVHSIYGLEAYQRAHAPATGAEPPRTLQGIIERRQANLLADPALQGDWPEIAAVEHAFEGTPGHEQVLHVAARAGAGPAVARMTLHIATGDLGGFRAVEMHDDGQHGDEAAGDGIHAAAITAIRAGGKLRFWVEATARSGRVACKPGSGGARPMLVRAPGG